MRFYLPLNLTATEAHRLHWNHQYYSVDGVLLVPQQLTTMDDVQAYARNASVVLKLTPFQNQFRAKMLSRLQGNNHPTESVVFGVTLSVDITTGKLLEVLNLSQVSANLNEEGDAHLDPNKSVVVKLTDAEHNEFVTSLQALLETKMRPHLTQPFLSFLPELRPSEWRKDLPKQKEKGSLLPFQVPFPFSAHIERMHQDTSYLLDDMYCVNPACDCNEVTCIILSFDPNSQKEIVHGGFKYHLEKKSFKSMPNFPTQFNAQEWFKQFSTGHVFDLPFLFKSRYDFLRKG